MTIKVAGALLLGFGLLSGCTLLRPETPPAPVYDFDLNGDSLPDTRLTLGSCAAVPGATCLLVTSTVTPTKEVVLSSSQSQCSGHVVGRRLELIGDHVNDPLQEVAVLYCEERGGGTPPALAVVDAGSGQVVARAVAPPGQENAFTDYPRGPDGKRYPFLAPSFGDGETAQGRPIWGYLCLYKPDRPPDAKCGNGFVAVDTSPREGFFREVGGYLQDLDGDGWDDITLIFHQFVFTVSTRTAAPIGMTEYDVAAATEPGSPKWFHDGRNYGTHSAFTGTDGKLRTVMAGGMPVGAFDNVMCGVTSYVAVLESSPGQPASRQLSWSRYYGFSSATFREVAPRYAEDPSAVVARKADHQNGCIHTFSDSRSVMDGERVILFNYFRNDAPVNSCLREQYRLYLYPPWTPDKQRAWYACIAANRQSPGTWNMQVLRERDGTLLVENPNVYVWGATRDLLPTGETVYLVEPLPQHPVPFDLRERQPSPLLVRALVNGRWRELGTLPGAGRPLIRQDPGGGPKGYGSYTYFAELTLEDIDGDGLKDLQLADGTWVGYSASAQAFIQKTR